MKELEPTREETTLKSNGQTTSTLVIENVPSELAYHFVTGNYEKGHFPTKEEVIESIECKKDESVKEHSYRSEADVVSEMVVEQICNNREERLCHVESIGHTPEWVMTEEGTQVCRCQECGRILGYEKEHVHEFRIDYATYQEFLEVEALKEIEKRGYVEETFEMPIAKGKR